MRQTKLHWLTAIRAHQYVKNGLICVPLLTSHTYLNLSAILHTILAFIVFCLAASSIYLINDICDLKHDRQHPTKCKRPLASGELSVLIAGVTAGMFCLMALGLSCFLPVIFRWLLVGYMLLALMYSFILKQKLLLDVFALTLLYTIRIIAGIAAIQVIYSEWLIIFSVFFFLSLAFLKRYIELFFLDDSHKLALPGRNYYKDDLLQLSIFGIISGYLATLVFAFYINSEQIKVLYHHPEWMWSVCLLLLYWVSRIWMLANRGEVHEDPVLFVLKDKVSFLIVALIVGIMVLAR